MAISNQAWESKIRSGTSHLINFGCTPIIILIENEIKSFFESKGRVGRNLGLGIDGKEK